MYHGLDNAVNRQHDSRLFQTCRLSPRVAATPNHHAPEPRNALWKNAMRILLYGLIRHVKCPPALFSCRSQNFQGATPPRFRGWLWLGLGSRGGLSPWVPRRFSVAPLRSSGDEQPRPCYDGPYGRPEKQRPRQARPRCLGHDGGADTAESAGGLGGQGLTDSRPLQDWPFALSCLLNQPPMSSKS